MEPIVLKKNSGNSFDPSIVILYDELRSRNPVYVSRYWQGEFVNPPAEIVNVFGGGIRDKNVLESTKRRFKTVMKSLILDQYPFDGRVEFHGRRGHLQEIKIIFK